MRGPLPYVVMAALLAIGAQLTIIGVQGQRLDRLHEDKVRLTTQVRVLEQAAAQARMAQQVAEAYRRREAERAEALRMGVDALLTGDFADADTPLDPALGAFLDCMRRTGAGGGADCAGDLGRSAHSGADQPAASDDGP